MMEPSKSSLRFITQQAFFTAVRSGDLDSLKQIVGNHHQDDQLLPSDVSDLMTLQNDAGETALYIACDNNLEEVFSYLIKLCDFETVKIRSKSGLDAFHVAAKKGHLGMLFFPFFFSLFLFKLHLLDSVLVPGFAILCFKWALPPSCVVCAWRSNRALIV